MKITVIGTGYVGLVSGACLAKLGHDVLCFDVDEEKIANLVQGKIPIYEPGLEEIVIETLRVGQLHFTIEPKKAVDHGIIQFIAVGTPPDQNGCANMTYVFEAVDTIAQWMNEYKLIATKSTVPVGSAKSIYQRIQQRLTKRGANFDFGVISNPEFLKEGVAVEDFLKPDRIIIGTNDEQSRKLIEEVYRDFMVQKIPFVFTDWESAELIKYAANAMLATRISFINELANLAEVVGADIEQVREGIGADRRIGPDFLRPGCGYGGSCFPKDIQALINTTIEHLGEPPAILQAVEKINRRQKIWLVEKILHYFGPNLKNKRFALWGLAFKPGTDDLREAPSLEILNRLLEHQAIIQVYDPAAMAETKKIYAHQENIIYADNPTMALIGADALIIVTEWPIFQNWNLSQFHHNLKQPVIFDGRNLYSPAQMHQAGIIYFSIGRMNPSI